jgi:tRNA threonylcarbamoyladenosine biosynthesis protein TsaE
MTEELLSRSPEQTGAFASSLAAKSKPGDCYALIGDLGCGKTHFAKGFARGLGITEDITSPTFTLLEEYEGDIPFYHFDLYRIAEESELDPLFFEEYWEGDGVSLIEWADRALHRLPDHKILVRFEYIDATTRRLTIEYPDD